MTSVAGNAVTTTPTIANTTSVQVLARNDFRSFLMIQNNSAANIAVSLSGATLTGIAPTSTNPCIVIPSTAGNNILRFDAGFVPSGPITVYQSSGGAINTVTVVEA